METAAGEAMFHMLFFVASQVQVIAAAKLYVPPDVGLLRSGAKSGTSRPPSAWLRVGCD